MKKALSLILVLVMLCGTVPMTVFAAEEAEENPYKGKVISILGDSISTFAGYIPTADGFNLEHLARYPQDNLLTDVKETWWMQVITRLDAKLGINESWRSTEVYNYIDEEVNSTYDGTKACMASVTRIQNLGSNGTPDVILFFGGTNDITQSRTMGTFDPATAPTEVDLTSVKWDTVADAYVDAIMRMQYYYPDAQIVTMLPFYRNSQGNAKVDQYNSLFAAICEHYGVSCVDLRYCGISDANLPDGTHPEANGMDYITDAVMDMLASECNVTAGEHIVHSVTHNLNGATSSKGYYKGVSDGKPFSTEIIGENLKITVTMGGADITDIVLKNNKVTIPQVTGDVSITVEGKKKNVYEDYVQQLPNELCCGINLWNSLDHQHTYYKGSSWGNNSDDAIYSVTIPTVAGDQIWATSFQAKPANGNTSSSSNGIRVTWFDENGVLKSMSTSEVYSEFSTNGYLTAPNGAVAVNIPMWNNSDDNELYILNRDHSYENGACVQCGATVSPYLQQLPENIVGCTNLYDSLVPVKGYYTATKYDTSNGAVLSVVIPVEPGDRIAASSFGAVSENMGSINGIRVTYLLGDKIATSLSAGEVYSGYTNNGYITVPEGVDAVCVPWWVPGDSNWLTLSQISKDFAIHSPKTVSAQAPTCTENGYTAGEICEVCNISLGEREEIPPTGHAYSGDTCTICGAINIKAILGGKSVSILGDSISTFNGYSNDVTVNTTIGENSPRYDAGTADTKPGSYCLLESVDQTWWMHFANRSGMKLLVNNSWAGSQVFGGKTSDGRVIPAAYLDRCVNLHDNTLENNPGNEAVCPDVIFVYLGINDYNFNRGKVGTGTVDYAGLVSSDGTYVTPTTFGEAYGILLHKMQNAYPDAQIFAMTLLPENLYSVDMTAWAQHNACIRAAAEYYNIPLVDLAENCAITWENYSGYMIDKIHPTTAGMELISDCIETEFIAYYKENRPHVHTSVIDAAVAATCTETGLTAGSHCETCGEILVMQEVVPAIGHIYENGICICCGAKPERPVVGWNLTLGEDIGMNFLVSVNEALADQTYVNITVADGETVSYKVSEHTPDENGNYLFRVHVAAAQMTDDVKLQTFVGDEAGQICTYTVERYAEAVLNDESLSGYHALVREMLNYGAAAQAYFEYNPEKPIDPALYAGAGANGIAEATAPDMTVSGSIDGVAFYGATLLHRSKTALRFYFTGVDMSRCRIAVGGNVLQPVQKDGLWYVELSDILPQSLNEPVTVNVVYNQERIAISYSPMNYMVRMCEKGSDSLQILLKSMYNYHLAAKAFLEGVHFFI